MKTTSILLTFAATLTLAVAQSTSPTTTTAAPITVQTAGGFTYIGCYTDDNNQRGLTGISNPVSTTLNSVDTCASACSAYEYFGVEWAQECYCGNTINPPSVLVAGSDPGTTGCNYICKGNSSEYCGGSGRLNVYMNTNLGSSSSSSTTTSSSSSPAIAVSSSPSSSSSPAIAVSSSLSSSSTPVIAVSSSLPSSSTPAIAVSSSLFPSSSIAVNTLPTSSTNPRPSSPSPSAPVTTSSPPLFPSSSPIFSPIPSSSPSSNPAPPPSSNPSPSTSSSPATSGSVCAKLAALGAYYNGRIAQLKAQKITIPPYLAGYYAANYDAAVAMKCPEAKSTPSANAATAAGKQPIDTHKTKHHEGPGH